MSEEITITTLQQVIEFVGTFAFAISGIRLAAYKHFDWFGGYVCGFVVAIGGGTIRDIMLGATPFWMTTPIYVLCTALALVFMVMMHKYVHRFNHTWLVFDTLGLALFTIAGIQKSLAYGQPFWVAIIMGCITGSAGGVMRDIFLNCVPLIFRKEIYAMACVAGGCVYWMMYALGIDEEITVAATFAVVCLIRYFAVKYRLSLPHLRAEK